MARKPINDNHTLGQILDPVIRAQIEEEMLEKVERVLPPDFDMQHLNRILLDYGQSIWFLEQSDVDGMSKPKVLEKARAILSIRGLIQPGFDGDSVTGIVIDGAHPYHPEFSYRFDNAVCDCREPTAQLCSHLVALLTMWMQHRSLFLPLDLPSEQQEEIMATEFGEMGIAITGESSYPKIVAKLLSAPAHAKTTPQAVPQLASPLATATTLSSTGNAKWPTASDHRVAPPPLKETIEAEFNTTQLRELAKNLGVKLKGTSKSAFVEQIVLELQSRTRRMRQTPELLLEGLADDQANLVRQAMTARDYFLPLPRNLTNALWLQLTNRDTAKRSVDALDVLRRKAILFPTRNYMGSRDVYYQWLPLEACGGSVPLMSWSAKTLLAKNAAARPTPEGQINFLDALEKLIGALMSSGAEIRASLPRHKKADAMPWLQNWEHDASEAELLLNSRPGWVPNPSSGISVPMHSPLTQKAHVLLEGLTGLSGAQCDFLFGIAAALQLVEAPDQYAKNGSSAKHLRTAWKVGARASAIEEWFALSDEDKLMRTWAAWRQLVPFGFEATRAARRAPSEGSVVETSRFQVMRTIGTPGFQPADLASEWAAMRRYITRVLTGLPRNGWISWPELRKQLFEFYPGCQWSMFGVEQWWLNAPGKPTRLDLNHYDDWQKTVGAVIEIIIAESLCWFGVVEINSGKNGLEAFRITELLDWLNQAQVISADSDPAEPPVYPRLPAQAQPRPRKIEPVKWLSDSRWHLPPAPNRSEFINFARLIADPVDVPFTYALTATSIERAISAGITIDEVTRQFDRMGAPLPADARAMYESIAERFGRVRLYESLTVLQLADDYALRELMSATSLGQHVIYQISSRAVVIKAEAVNGLVGELIAKGYTPGVQ